MRDQGPSMPSMLMPYWGSSSSHGEEMGTKTLWSLTRFIAGDVPAVKYFLRNNLIDDELDQLFLCKFIYCKIRFLVQFFG